MDNQTPSVGDAEMGAKPKMSKKAMTTIVVIILLIVAGLIALRLSTAAKVNGDSISKKEYRKELESQYGKRVMDALVAKELVNQEAEKRNIEVGDADVDAEVAKIKTQLEAQGTTLEAALASQGLTDKSLRDQIETGKKLEKILADKIAVTDADVTNYIKENKITVPAGSEAQAKAEITSLLSQQKLAAEADKWITEVKAAAKIKYYVAY